MPRFAPVTTTRALMRAAYDERGSGGGALRREVDLDEDVVLDEVVRHAGVDDAEILPVDPELGLHRDGAGGDLDPRGERDALRRAAELEVAGDGVRGRVSAGGLDRRRDELRGRELLHVEEIGRLEVVGELVDLLV